MKLRVTTFGTPSENNDSYRTYISSQPAGVGSVKSPPLVEEIHYASRLSRRSVAYPDRATPLPQVPSSHDASPYRTRTCGLRSADLRMSQVRTRPKGADRRPIKSEKAGWLNSELKPPEYA